MFGDKLFEHLRKVGWVDQQDHATATDGANGDAKTDSKSDAPAAAGGDSNAEKAGSATDSAADAGSKQLKPGRKGSHDDSTLSAQSGGKLAVASKV